MYDTNTGWEDKEESEDQVWVLDNYHCNEEKKEASKERDSSYDTQQYTALAILPNNEIKMIGVHAKVTILPNTICYSISIKSLVIIEMGQATEIGQIVL